MSTPFKMKGSPMKRNFGVRKDDKEIVTIVDKEKTEGYQQTVTSGVKTFPTVKKLKDANAPKSVIDAEYNKQMALYKQKHKLT